MSNGQLQAFALTGRRDVAPSELTDREALASFVARRDEAAFRALVERHGPMVARVCRNAAGDAHAAEDAFQATFLVLARRADEVEVRGSLAGWLCGVAYRVAKRARADLARRRAQETQGGAMAEARPDLDAARDELYRALHDEVARLPGPLRDPMVLCYLEGLTNEEAARQLGWPAGTVKTRLAKGRERLRSRLARRGLALTVALLFVDLNRAKVMAFPAASVDRAVDLAAGRDRPDRIVAALVAASLGTSPGKLLIVLAALVGVGAVAAGAGPLVKELSTSGGLTSGASCH